MLLNYDKVAKLVQRCKNIRINSGDFDFVSLLKLVRLAEACQSNLTIAGCGNITFDQLELLAETGKNYLTIDLA